MIAITQRLTRRVQRETNVSLLKYCKMSKARHVAAAIVSATALGMSPPTEELGISPTAQVRPLMYAITPKRKSRNCAGDSVMTLIVAMGAIKNAVSKS